MALTLRIFAWTLASVAVFALFVIAGGPARPDWKQVSSPLVLSLGFALGGAPFTTIPLLLAWGAAVWADRISGATLPSITRTTMKYAAVTSLVVLLVRPQLP